MTSLLNKTPRTVLQNNYLMLEIKRFRGKINIQRPRQPHYERAKALKLTEPYYESKRKNLSYLELCGNLRPSIYKKNEDNPFQRILAKECLNWFNHSRLIGLFHLNPMHAEERFNALFAFKKSNMHLQNYGLKTLQTALYDTKYEAFTHNYISQNIFVFSPEPNIKEMIKISKKFPQMILLYGIFEGKYVNKDELIKYSQISDVQVARAQLVQTLQNVAGNFVNKLTQQQNSLIRRLEDRANQLKPVE